MRSCCLSYLTINYLIVRVLVVRIYGSIWNIYYFNLQNLINKMLSQNHSSPSDSSFYHQLYTPASSIYHTRHHSQINSTQTSSLSLHHHLKKQRQNMQEITQLYQKQQQQLAKCSVKENHLQSYINELEELAEYKQSYHQLKIQYQALFTELQIIKYDNSILKQELQARQRQYHSKVQQLELVCRTLKHDGNCDSSHHKQIIKEKDEELQKIEHKIRLHQIQTSQEIKVLDEQNHRLLAKLKQQDSNFTAIQQQLKTQLRMKGLHQNVHQKIAQTQKEEIYKLRRQIERLKSQLQTAVDEDDSTRKQVLLQNDCLSGLLRQNTSEVYRLKQELMRLQCSNNNLEKVNAELMKGNVKMTANIQSKMKNIYKSREEERIHMQDQIYHLKKQIQTHISDYNYLCAQNKNLKRQLQKGQCRYRNNRSKILSEFKSMDRQQRSLKR